MTRDDERGEWDGMGWEGRVRGEGRHAQMDMARQAGRQGGQAGRQRGQAGAFRQSTVPC